MEGWQEFYRLYGDLLRRFALKRGLTEVEAVEVVLETTIGVVALAVHGWVRETGTSGNGVPAERASVFILPFRRPTVGEALEGSLADRMTDAFIDSLAAIRGVRRSPKRLAWVLGDEAQLLASLARTTTCAMCSQTGPRPWKEP